MSGHRQLLLFVFFLFHKIQIILNLQPDTCHSRVSLRRGSAGLPYAGKHFLVGALLPWQYIPILPRSPGHPDRPVLHYSKEPYLPFGYASLKQANRQLLDPRTKTSHSNARHGRSELLYLSNTIPRVYLVDYRRSRGDREQTGRGTVLQHPVFLQDDGVPELRR